MEDHRRVPPELDWLAYEMKLLEKMQDLMGREVLDQTPVELPLGYTRGPDLTDMIRQMVKGELLRRHAEQEGDETFEEADDFSLDDGDWPESPYEDELEPPVVPARAAVAPAKAGADAPSGASSAPAEGSSAEGPVTPDLSGKP